MTDKPLTHADLIAHTARVAAAFFMKNPTSIGDVKGVFRQIYDGLLELPEPNRPAVLAAAPDLVETTRETPTIQPVPVAPPVESPKAFAKPSVDPQKSVFPDHILCLVCAKTFRRLRRHISSHDLTVDEYLSRFGLDDTYPLVAPNDLAKCRERAMDNKFGHKRPRFRAEAVRPEDWGRRAA